MPEPLAGEALCAKGLAMLTDHLGPVDALRFSALLQKELLHAHRGVPT